MESAERVLTSHWVPLFAFISSSKFLSKKYSRKIIFVQTKLDENNFTSCMWWALIEEIALRAEEMAGEKEMACCVRGYQVYKDIWAAAIGEVLVCSREPTNAEKNFVVKIRSRKIFSYIFFGMKIFLQQNKSELRYFTIQAVLKYFPWVAGFIRLC